jgi:hypothetical protein
LIEYVSAKDNSIVEWNSIQDLATPGMEVLEAIEVIDCPPKDHIKRSD